MRMSRRAIPCAVFIGALLIAVSLLAVRVRASRPSPLAPDLLGHWDGYFLEPGGTAAPGVVRSDVTHQGGWRFAGDGRLIEAATGAWLTPYEFGGRLETDDLFTAAGRTPAGRLAMQGSLLWYGGRHGAAGVMDAQIMLIPRRGQESQVGATLLRPFPDRNAPDVSGNGLGEFRSRRDSTFVGGLDLQIRPRDRGAFPSVVSFTPLSNLHPPFTWVARATINDRGRMILIAQGKSGKMVVDGTVFPRTPGSPSTAVDGLYTLFLNDGHRDFGTYNFNLTPRLP